MSDVAEQRAEVAAKAQRWGKTPLAAAARVNRGTLYRFLGGDDLTDRTRTELVEAVRSLPDEPPPRRRKAARPTESATAPAAQSAGLPDELLPGYWRGRLAEIAENLEAATGRVRAFLAHGDRWEVGSVLARLGTLPSPDGLVRPTDTVALAQALVEHDRALRQTAADLEREAREREGAEPAGRPARRRAAGGG